jgi:hypothetical protein
MRYVEEGRVRAITKRLTHKAFALTLILSRRERR